MFVFVLRAAGTVPARDSGLDDEASVGARPLPQVESRRLVEDHIVMVASRCSFTSLLNGSLALTSRIGLCHIVVVFPGSSLVDYPRWLHAGGSPRRGGLVPYVRTGWILPAMRGDRIVARVKPP